MAAHPLVLFPADFFQSSLYAVHDSFDHAGVLSALIALKDDSRMFDYVDRPCAGQDEVSRHRPVAAQHRQGLFDPGGMVALGFDAAVGTDMIDVEAVACCQHLSERRGLQRASHGLLRFAGRVRFPSVDRPWQCEASGKLPATYERPFSPAKFGRLWPFHFREVAAWFPEAHYPSLFGTFCPLEVIEVLYHSDQPGGKNIRSIQFWLDADVLCRSTIRGKRRRDEPVHFRRRGSASASAGHEVIEFSQPRGEIQLPRALRSPGNRWSFYFIFYFWCSQKQSIYLQRFRNHSASHIPYSQAPPIAGSVSVKVDGVFVRLSLMRKRFSRVWSLQTHSSPSAEMHLPSF